MRWLPVSSAVIAGAMTVLGIVWADESYEAADTRERAEAITGGEADLGRKAFIEKGCGGCHAIRGVAQATGLVGPPLDGIAERAVIAGKLENTPQNLVNWIAHPQAIVPGNAMPEIPLSDAELRNLAAFLYTRT